METKKKSFFGKLGEKIEDLFIARPTPDEDMLDELEEICALPGIDMIFFGPGDFSQGIGIPTQTSDPRVAEVRKKVAECARRHGKFAGTVGGTGNFDQLVAEGYTFISVGADVVGMWQYFQDITKQISDRDIAEASK